MEYLNIGQTINIKRSDGSIQHVTVTSKNIDHDSITTEWTEGKNIRGKEVSMNIVLSLNETLFKNLEHMTNEKREGQMNDNCNKGDANTASGAKRNIDTYRKSQNNTFVTTRILSTGNKIQSSRSGMSTRKTQSLIGTRNLSKTGSQVKGGGRMSEITSKQSKNKSSNTTPYVPLNGQRKSNPNVTPSNMRCSSVVREVERMKEERERRRALQVEQRQEKCALMSKDPGNPNWEVAMMVRQYRDTLVFKPLRDLSPCGARVQQITVCVRKRPMSRLEISAKNIDVISVPSVESCIVHELRNKVDLTKFLEHHKFRFDYTFDEKCSNKLVYEYTARPLIRTMFEGGNATCFAYGQTGSGKTHTMGGEFIGKVQNCSTGIYAMAAKDVFAELTHPEYRTMGAQITCSFFEIYGTKVFDLLHPDKPLLRVLEDGNQQVVIVGLTEKSVTKVDDVLRLIELGNRERTSGKTSANVKSSRSHAVFQIGLHKGDSLYGKCSFVDLAGNERGADTKTANRQTRIEGAEINKSLLALKECIRALSRGSGHLPFRGSKLTQVLRDSFVGGKRNKTCMIAMIAPGLTSVEHTLNTLRYADRVKELVAKDDETYTLPQQEDNLDANDSFLDSELELHELQSQSPRSNISVPDNDNSHIPDCSYNSIITISSEEAVGYNGMSSGIEEIDINPDFSNILSNNRSPVTLSQVMIQHRVLNEYIGNFIRNFEDLGPQSEEYNPKLSNYLDNADPTFHELITLATYTRDMILNLKGQRSLSKLATDNTDNKASN